MSQQKTSALLQELTLGKTTSYTNQYDPTLLQAVPRTMARDTLGEIDTQYLGQDIWTGYEVSWLEPTGKPVVKIVEFVFQAHSENLVESKSFKLYLNSFNQTRFKSEQAVKKLMQQDLAAMSGEKVEVTIYSLDQYTQKGLTLFSGELIDDAPIEIDTFEYNPKLLTAETPAENVNETLTSHLLKSNCLVTGQPDWGSVLIQYSGPKICRSSLLTYLIGFRNHNEFHEHCVERIYTDINNQFKPDELLVYARYTRRGGLDINPIRASHTQLIAQTKWYRLARQ
ncbi:NADPH-dependent 7-cyano-7-deazaguanine reductase QueF [Catenovulum adriaticum]|uniref:NADPH-dependent 7-cyano-7-deazaguanine reductase n=1 Tax=Catenovulum adriaticum TaxID=2984846 RepID=A0ABY7AMW3_9ALTE|nr:NADPH-dependent 7-cyano-7-deazaguanine reductase QueF [Catenovulum sp. TS8]WAJ70889.1 NADPH-dependent 7-cyano-7-deazaguanine reductase QueF [Catenovulum sp. TS8]